MSNEQFVSESLIPIADSFDAAPAAIGEPALPRAFNFRDQRMDIAKILDQWKESAPCPFSRGREKYLRKHWYKLLMNTGDVFTIYFERQPRSTAQTKKRWWVYTIESARQNSSV